MNAAILCPGPSLAKWPDSMLMAYPLRIAVNRAVHRAPCTQWVMADLNPFTQDPPATPLPIWTSESIVGFYPPGLATAYETLGQRHPFLVNTYSPDGVVDWRSFSSTAALIVAAHLGAEVIDVYGADWTNEPDFDGKSINQGPHERAPERWKAERQIWDAVGGYLTSLGISVNRILYVIR
jgi:hypothetical protein